MPLSFISVQRKVQRQNVTRIRDFNGNRYLTEIIARSPVVNKPMDLLHDSGTNCFTLRHNINGWPERVRDAIRALKLHNVL